MLLKRCVLSCSVQTDEEDWLCKLCPVRDPLNTQNARSCSAPRAGLATTQRRFFSGRLMAFLWRAIFVAQAHSIRCFLAVDQRRVFRVEYGCVVTGLGRKHARLWKVKCNYSSSYSVDSFRSHAGESVQMNLRAPFIMLSCIAFEFLPVSC